MWARRAQYYICVLDGPGRRTSCTLMTAFIKLAVQIPLAHDSGARELNHGDAPNFCKLQGQKASKREHCIPSSLSPDKSHGLLSCRRRFLTCNSLPRRAPSSSSPSRTTGISASCLAPLVILQAWTNTTFMLTCWNKAPSGPQCKTA